MVFHLVEFRRQEINNDFNPEACFLVLSLSTQFDNITKLGREI